MAGIASTSLKWTYTPEEIGSVTEELMSKQKAVLDAVASAPVKDWASVMLPLATLDRDLEAVTASITFLKDVSTSEAVRDAAAAAQSKLSAFEIEQGMRLDVYQSVQAFASNTDMSGFDAESKRLVERTIRDGVRKGLNRPEEVREQIKTLRTRISDQSIKYQKALGEIDTKLSFTRQQLAGLPEPFIASLDIAVPLEEDAAAGSKPSLETHPDGPFLIELNYPHVVPLMKLCSVPATRAAVEKAFASRAHPDNTGILHEVVELRRQLAALLGYDSFASYVLEDRMARTTSDVMAFLNDLNRDLKPAAQLDLQSLTALKHAEEGADSGPLKMSDYRYYMEKELAAKYSVDHDAIKDYFPLKGVVEKMLEMYEKIFSIKFTKLEGPDELPETATWHPDVTAYRIDEARTDGAAESSALLGYVFLDMYPRQGKYGHAAVFPLISGCEAGDMQPTGTDAASGRIYPVAAMVCNFPKPSATTPSLIRHEDAVTLLHETGHVLHHCLSKTRYLRFASFRCEQDFVEAPSQMLENWPAASVTALEFLSGHWQDPAKKLPRELAESVVKSRRAHQGLANMRQVFLALFDMRLHSLPAKVEDGQTAPKVDSEALLRDLHENVLGIPMTEGTNFGASFGHLLGGYESAYYGYLWSEVFAADMYEFGFSGEESTHAAAGLRYRDIILGSGGSVDARDFLHKFLGREPSNKAFMRSKGLLLE